MSGKGGLPGASSDKPAALYPASIGLQIMYRKPGRVCRFGNRNPMLRSQGSCAYGTGLNVTENPARLMLESNGTLPALAKTHALAMFR